MNGIRTQREAHDMSQSELARQLRVTPQTVNQWEAGIIVPRLPKLIAMSQLFGCTLDDLCSDNRSGENAG